LSCTCRSLLGITFFLRILGFRFIHFLKEYIHEGIFHLLITADHGIFDLMVGCGCFSATPPVFSEPSPSRNLSANLSSMP